MFHPVRHYDASYPGYVDIGMDGVKIAAVTIGPEPTCPRNGAVAEAQFP